MTTAYITLSIGLATVLLAFVMAENSREKTSTSPSPKLNTSRDIINVESQKNI